MNGTTKVKAYRSGDRVPSHVDTSKVGDRDIRNMHAVRAADAAVNRASTSPTVGESFIAVNIVTQRRGMTDTELVQYYKSDEYIRLECLRLARDSRGYQSNPPSMSCIATEQLEVAERYYKYIIKGARHE